MFRIEKMCSVLSVSRSGFYKWLNAKESERSKQHQRITRRVHFHYQDTQGIYGARKITYKLQAEGIQTTERTVSRIMKENHLRSCTVRKFKVQTTDSSHSMPISPNILNQQFKTSAPNKVWVTDITYIRTRQGMMYLASVLDLYTRKIVGWKLGNRMTVNLVLNALEQAYKAQRPGKGLLHHSDRGSQYASSEYRKRLKKYGMISSMSRKGNCYDNACIESFHSLLKREYVHHRKFPTQLDAEQGIYWYIEFFYNRKRIHGSLGYLSPDRFESQYYRSKTA